MAAQKLAPICNKHGIPKEYRANGERPQGVQAFAYVCTECKKETHSAWRLENAEYVKQTKQNTPKKVQKNWQLKSKYGITLEDYNQLFIQQNGCCKICERHQSQFKKALAVDHCHSTGKVRGLLCTSCNNGLGRFKDSAELLKIAANYIEANR